MTIVDQAPSDRGTPQPAGGVRRPVELARAHPVEIAFGLVLLLAFIGLMQMTTGTYFFGDDWSLLFQARTVGGMLEPYNGHLSVIILGVYRAFIELFGFSYGPFQTLGLVCLLAVPATFFFTTRRVLGPPLAAIMALSLLGFAEMELNPAWFNHYLALIGGIGCAAALNRGRRGDVPVALLLALSLAAAGGGVAVAAACLVHSACTRAPRARWLAVLAPCVLWGLWWLAFGREARFRGLGASPSLSDSVAVARDIAWSPFAHIGSAGPVAAALVVAFVGYGVWVLRQGLAQAASFLGWTAALVVWSAGVAYARSTFSLVGEIVGVPYRYQLLALGFTLLAVVPPRPIAWPPRFPLATDRRWLTTSAVAILAIAAVGWSAVRADVRDRSDAIASRTRLTRGEMVAADLGPAAIEDDVRMGPRFFWLHADDVRTVLRRYETPFESTVRTADRQLVDLRVPIARQADAVGLPCQRLTEPMEWLQESRHALFLWSDQPTWTVSVRRFGSEWIELASGGPADTFRLFLPPLSSEVPWEVRADGACLASSDLTERSG